MTFTHRSSMPKQRALAILAAVSVASIAIAGCAQQREAAGPEDVEVPSSAASADSTQSGGPDQGMLKPSQLCIENNSSMPVTINWKHADASDGDCGRGNGHNDEWSEDVVASIVVNGQVTVLAAADNEAFQRPSVAIQDETLGAAQCFSFRAYLDMGESYKFRSGERFDDGIAAYELRRESLEGPYKEMRVIIYDSADPVDNVRQRHCN